MTEFHSGGTRRVTRAQFVQIGLGAGIAGVLPLRLASTAWAASSSNNAVTFLNRMMDCSASGSALRLAQSYVPTAALNLPNVAFTYDNAVLILAYLTQGELQRAVILGDSLLYAQQHDPEFNDGRLRAAYYTAPFVGSGGAVTPTSWATTTGVMAWAGLALTALYLRTRQPRHLNGAKRIADWIEQRTSDTRGAGGFSGGVARGGSVIPWKATEHNIDAVAFFRLLAVTTWNYAAWQQAQRAETFVASMWNADAGHLWTGTGNDGVSTNTDAVPEDVQAWSYLALRNPRYASALDWAARNLSAVDGPFAGVSFDSSDRSGVWFEGTGHLAAALRQRRAPGDAVLANSYLDTLRLAQSQAPNADGFGIVAASRDGLRTVDGDSYFAALHTGATAWYLLAQAEAVW